MSKRAFANQERQQQVERMSKMGRATLMLLATVLSFSAIGLSAMDQLYRPDRLQIDQLKIKGKFRYLQPVEVETVVRQQSLGNFFSVDLVKLKHNIEQVPWVQSADVRREWPNTLLVRIEEHRPVMRWGMDKWINSVGEVIELPADIQLSNPIVLNGNPRDAELILHTAIRWKRRLGGQGVELKGLTLSERHAWTVSLYDPLKDQKFDVLLGREEIELRLTRFEYLFADQFRNANAKLKRVDARYPDGLAVSAEIIESSQSLAMQTTNLSLTKVSQ